VLAGDAAAADVPVLGGNTLAAPPPPHAETTVVIRAVPSKRQPTPSIKAFLHESLAAVQPLSC